MTARLGPPQTLVPSRATAVSLQRGLGTHMEEPRGNMKYDRICGKYEGICEKRCRNMREI